MTGIIFKLTDAGRAALVNAAHDGTQARRIVSVGITASAFTPTAALAAIPGEIKRLTTFAGDVVAADTIHLTIRDDGADTYTVRGLGLYLDNGVLMGTYSQAAVILEKSAASIFLLAADLRVLDGSVDISTLQFGDTSFLNPPATIERQGVVELATVAEANALVDTTRALTPASVQPLFAARALTSTSIEAGAGLTGGGSLAENRTLQVKFGTEENTAAHGNHTHAAATTAAAGLMSAADKTKLDGIAAQANKYAHPSGDGNLHVPATGTSNSGKVLTAGATAGSLSWTAPLALGTTASTAAEGNHTHAAATVSAQGLVELATNAETQTGTDATRAVTPAGLAAVTLGLRQSWINVKASRTWNTVYTNTTGRAIAVQVCAQDTASGNLSIELYVNGLLLSKSYASASFLLPAFAIVPANGTYEVRRQDNNDTIVSWVELR